MLQGRLVLQTLSHQPLHHHHCLKNARAKKKGVRLAANWVDEHKGDGSDYLSNYKRARLPRDLCGVVFQILIIISRNDRRDLLFRVFTEEDGRLLWDGGRSLHEAFACPILYKGDRLALSHQPHDGLQRNFGFLSLSVSFRQRLPLYRWVAGHRRRRSHVAGLLLLSSLRPDQCSPLGIVHLWKSERIKLTTRISYDCLSKVKVTNLRLRVLASYLRAVGVGFSSSQYQCMVLRLTNFAQVLSSGWVFEKIFLRKPNSSTSTYGRRLTAKKKDG